MACVAPPSFGTIVTETGANGKWGEHPGFQAAQPDQDGRRAAPPAGDLLPRRCGKTCRRRGAPGRQPDGAGLADSAACGSSSAACWAVPKPWRAPKAGVNENVAQWKDQRSKVKGQRSNAKRETCPLKDAGQANAKVERGVQAERNDRPPIARRQQVWLVRTRLGSTNGDEGKGFSSTGGARQRRTDVLAKVAYHRTGDLSRGV